MEIIESDVFLWRIGQMIDDLELWSLEEYVAANPDAGALIPGGKGLRKLRWAIPKKGRGTRGGMRVIYYYLVGETIFLLDAYSKSEKENLSKLELADLIATVKEWKDETRA